MGPRPEHPRAVEDQRNVADSVDGNDTAIAPKGAHLIKNRPATGLRQRRPGMHHPPMNFMRHPRPNEVLPPARRGHRARPIIRPSPRSDHRRVPDPPVPLERHAARRSPSRKVPLGVQNHAPHRPVLLPGQPLVPRPRLFRIKPTLRRLLRSDPRGELRRPRPAEENVLTRIHDPTRHGNRVLEPHEAGDRAGIPGGPIGDRRIEFVTPLRRVNRASARVEERVVFELVDQGFHHINRRSPSVQHRLPFRQHALQRRLIQRLQLGRQILLPEMPRPAMKRNRPFARKPRGQRRKPLRASRAVRSFHGVGQIHHLPLPLHAHQIHHVHPAMRKPVVHPKIIRRHDGRHIAHLHDLGLPHPLDVRNAPCTDFRNEICARHRMRPPIPE